jgi:predicted GNAT family acetyltransferase
MSEFQILHQAEEDLFYVALEDGQRAYIKYRRSDSKSAIAQVDFWTTFVPETYRGKGLAALLVERAFEWADKQNLFITTSCWYAAKKLEQRKLQEQESEDSDAV